MHPFPFLCAPFASALLVYSMATPRHASSSSDGTVESVEDNTLDEVTAEDLDIEKKSTKNNGNGQAAAIQSPKDTFYFYQSSDGK